MLKAGIPWLNPGVFLLRESSLEGAGYMKIFWSVISPLCKPLYAAIALFTAAYHWNAWFDSMFYNMFEPRYRTMIHILERYYTEIPSSEGVEYHSFYLSAPIKAAVTIIAMAPLLIAYPFLQKYFVTGLTIGGVKE